MSIEQPPTKWQVYEQILGIPYYVVFDRYSDRMRAFELVSDRYQEIELPEPRLWMPTLNLGLGIWQGDYRGIRCQWLRWYDAQGDWIPTDAEREHQRAERLAERLRALGVDPEGK